MLRKVGSTATVLMMSAATRNSSPKRIARPRSRRYSTYPASSESLQHFLPNRKVAAIAPRMIVATPTISNVQVTRSFHSPKSLIVQHPVHQIDVNSRARGVLDSFSSTADSWLPRSLLAARAHVNATCRSQTRCRASRAAVEMQPARITDAETSSGDSADATQFAPQLRDDAFPLFVVRQRVDYPWPTAALEARLVCSSNQSIERSLPIGDRRCRYRGCRAKAVPFE
jgi:hypothetical protein